MGCGFILQDHAVDEGTDRRTFKTDDGGIEDRNFHGPAPDRRLPDHINLATRTVLHNEGREYSRARFRQLQKECQQIENRATEGDHGDRRTTVTYRSDQIRQADAMMEEMAQICNIHKVVVNAAKEE